MAVIRGKRRRWDGDKREYLWDPCLILDFTADRLVVIALDPDPTDKIGGLILQTVAMTDIRLLRTGVPL